MVKFAESQIGVPYVWGGETRAGLWLFRSRPMGLVQGGSEDSSYYSDPVTGADPRGPWRALLADLLYYYNLDGDHQVDYLVM